MSQKSKRLKQSPVSAIAPIYRAYGLQPRSVNEAERTVRALITTESPVMEFDWKRYEFVPRVLLTSGAQFPESGQIPFLDSHNRQVMDNQLGSARGLEKTTGGVEGELKFSSTAERQWTMVREGHATDVSAGFQVLAEIYVDACQTQRIQGKDYTGPINVATKWRLYEVSLTPIGADEQAKLRGFDPSNIPQQEEGFEMNDELKKLLLSRGMPADFTDEQAQKWIVDNPDKMGRAAPEEPKKTQTAQDLVEELDRRAMLREQARQEQRRAFIADIDEHCSLADMSAEFARSLYDLPDIAAVRAKIKEEKAEQAKRGAPQRGYSAPRITREGRDEFRKAVLTSMVDRVFKVSGVTDETGATDVSSRTRKAILPDEQRGKGSHDFDRMPVTEIGRRCLIADGYRDEDVRRLDSFDLATAVFRGGHAVGLETRDSGTLHNTSSFAYITENTMNKSMRTGYMEARTTYQRVASIGEPVPDFKPKNVYTTSAVGNLTVWPDGTKPNLTSFMDYKDSYGVEAYANMLEYTWQLFVNDDMNAIIRSPAKLGDACRRSINAYAWGIVTSNPTLADGQSLFLASATGNRKKANYISSGLAVTVASLGALEELMRQQVGQNTREGNTGPDILNIEPRILVTPTAVVRNTAMAIVRSVADPASSNANVHNPYNNVLEVIDEPLLAANSTTAWYLVADPNLVDGIELSFLQGFEQPRTWSGVEEKTLTRWWAIAQVWGGKAIDHRGWAKQAGA